MISKFSFMFLKIFYALSSVSMGGHIVSPLSIHFVLKMVIRETFFLPLNDWKIDASVSQ